MEIRSFKEFEKIYGKGNIGGVLVICGEEKHLVDKSIKLVYESITSFPDLNIIKIDGELPLIDPVINACETLPFLSDKKLVHIKGASFLSKGGNSPADYVKNLSNYIKNLSEEVLLLISFEGQSDSGSTLLKTIKAIGTLVEYKKLKGEELHGWVMEVFEDNGKGISRSDIIYLTAEIGSSVDSLQKEIEKICSYAMKDETVTRQHIDAVIHRGIESNIFKMVDSVSKKDANSALLVLNVLLFQREEHLKILGMIIRQMRLLFTIKIGLKEKKAPGQINEELKLNEYVFNNLIKQSKNFSEESLRISLRLCLETDFRLKGGVFSGEFNNLALEMLIIELCK